MCRVNRIAVYILLAGGLAVVPFLAQTTELSSTNFKILEPVFQIGGGGQMSSDSFRLWGSVGQMAIGTSTIDSFRLAGGFLFSPYASSPVVSASAGDGQVSLSWSASSGALGWTVSGYNVGQSTTSGGPYSYSASIGNVTSSTRTGLTNGTTYYFVVRAEDAFGNSVATSSEVSAAPAAAAVTPTVTPSGGGGGGGGGAGFITAPTKVLLRGRAYPAATVTVLRDGVVAKIVETESSANWKVEFEISPGIYTFSVYAVDSRNRRSLTTSFTTNVAKETTTIIGDIIIAPTIEADKSQVKIGSDIQFFGSAYPSSTVNVIINSEHAIEDAIASDKFGLWLYKLDSGLLERGEHSAKTQVVTPDYLRSTFSESVIFQVGDSDVAFRKVVGRPAALPPPAVCSKNGDINNDGKVNLIDFSIMLFFWNQRNPKNQCADINGDGVVNLFDFSIMLFWWTG